MGRSYRLASGMFRTEPRGACGLQLLLSCVRSARRGRDEPDGEELLVAPLSAPSTICSAFGFYNPWLCRLSDPYCRRCSYCRDLQLSHSTRHLSSSRLLALCHGQVGLGFGVKLTGLLGCYLGRHSVDSAGDCLQEKRFTQAPQSTMRVCESGSLKEPVRA